MGRRGAASCCGRQGAAVAAHAAAARLLLVSRKKPALPSILRGGNEAPPETPHAQAAWCCEACTHDWRAAAQACGRPLRQARGRSGCSGRAAPQAAGQPCQPQRRPGGRPEPAATAMRIADRPRPGTRNYLESTNLTQNDPNQSKPKPTQPPPTHREARVYEVLIAVTNGYPSHQQRRVNLPQLYCQGLEYVVGVTPGWKMILKLVGKRGWGLGQCPARWVGSGAGFKGDIGRRARQRLAFAALQRPPITNLIYKTNQGCCLMQGFPSRC
jgi:hypothetical protein